MSRRAAAAALLALAVAGCAVGPNYRRPPVADPPTFRGEARAEPTSFADLPWWEVFHDDNLVALLREALETSQNIQAAAARVEQARAVAGIATDQLYPAITVEASPSYQQTFSPVQVPGLSLNKPYHTYLLQGSLSWEIDLWGRLRRLREAALAQYLGTEEAARGVVVSLISDIAQSYFQLMALDLQLDIARRTVAARRDTLALFEAQERGGVATRLQTASEEGNLADAEATIPTIEQAISVLENRISILVGRPPGPVTRGDDLVRRVVPPEPPVGVPGTLLERRPDLREAEAGLVAANAQVGAALAEFFPRLTVFGNGGVESTATSSLLTSGATIFGVGAILSWLVPVLNGYQTEHKVQSQRANWNALVATYRQALLNALAEVSNAIGSVQRIRAQRDRLEVEVRARRETVELARIQFRAGVASYLDVVQAEQNLFPAELELAQATGAQFTAIAELYRALGGGWRNAMAPPPAGPPAG